MSNDQSITRICPSCASLSVDVVCCFCGMLTEEQCLMCHEAKSNDRCVSAATNQAL